MHDTDPPSRNCLLTSRGSLVRGQPSAVGSFRDCLNCREQALLPSSPLSQDCSHRILERGGDIKAPPWPCQPNVRLLCPHMLQRAQWVPLRLIKSPVMWIERQDKDCHSFYTDFLCFIYSSYIRITWTALTWIPWPYH